MAVIVVGAGIAGLACARALTAAGVPVQVLERSRVPGGRLASKRFDKRPTDLGAAYFTVSDPAFDGVVQRWHAEGLARPWTRTL
ncbi:MAG TPA: FAD-dependent oxidoreductase, partial [Catenuloplanes sp.]